MTAQMLVVGPMTGIVLQQDGRVFDPLGRFPTIIKTSSILDRLIGDAPRVTLDDINLRADHTEALFQAARALARVKLSIDHVYGSWALEQKAPWFPTGKFQYRKQDGG